MGKTTRVLVGLVMLGVASAAVAADLQVCVGSQLPFWFSNDKGQPVGIEHDILAGFAKRHGMQLSVVAVDFTEQIARLQQGACDVGAARMTITAERQKSIDFSAPYFSVRVAVVMRRGEAVTELKGLAGKRVLVNSATSLESAFKAVPGVTLVPMDFSREMSAMLQSRDIDAFTSDSTMVQEFIKSSPELEIALFLPERDHYGFPMRKGDRLKKLLDTYIAGIKKDGSYVKILARYLEPETLSLILETKNP
jgi:polar amino acid transport system substrate-binding protein